MPDPRKILITGGSGFIGSRLALRCLRAGDAVRVLAQTNTRAEQESAEALKGAGAEFVHGSVTERDEVEAAVRDVDLVFHLAAAQHEMNVPDRRYWEVNVTGTRLILDAALATGVRRFVYGGTIGVYGRPRGGPLDERSPVDPDNLYGRTKLAAEELVRSYKDRLPVVVVRISEAYGPGDQRLLKLFTAIRKGAFLTVGSGKNLHHLIFIDDLVDGLLRAADAKVPSGEVFVLAGKEAVSTNQIVAAIAEELDRKPPRLHAPLWVFMAAAAGLETVLRPLGVQPPLHRRRMDFFRKNFAFTGDKAATMLGFRPSVGLREGIRQTAAWYRETGRL